MKEKYGDMMDRSIQKAMGSQVGMSSRNNQEKIPATTDLSGWSASSGASPSCGLKSARNIAPEQKKKK